MPPRAPGKQYHAPPHKPKPQDTSKRTPPSAPTPQRNTPAKTPMTGVNVGYTTGRSIKDQLKDRGYKPVQGGGDKPVDLSSVWRGGESLDALKRSGTFANLFNAPPHARTALTIAEQLRAHRADAVAGSNEDSLLAYVHGLQHRTDVGPTPEDRAARDPSGIVGSRPFFAVQRYLNLRRNGLELTPKLKAAYLDSVDDLLAAEAAWQAPEHRGKDQATVTPLPKARKQLGRFSTQLDDEALEAWDEARKDTLAGALEGEGRAKWSIDRARERSGEAAEAAARIEVLKQDLINDRTRQTARRQGKAPQRPGGGMAGNRREVAKEYTAQGITNEDLQRGDGIEGAIAIRGLRRLQNGVRTGALDVNSSGVQRMVQANVKDLGEAQGWDGIKAQNTLQDFNDLLPGAGSDIGGWEREAHKRAEERGLTLPPGANGLMLIWAHDAPVHSGVGGWAQDVAHNFVPGMARTLAEAPRGFVELAGAAKEGDWDVFKTIAKESARPFYDPEYWTKDVRYNPAEGLANLTMVGRTAGVLSRAGIRAATMGNVESALGKQVRGKLTRDVEIDMGHRQAFDEETNTSGPLEALKVKYALGRYDKRLGRGGAQRIGDAWSKLDPETRRHKLATGGIGKLINPETTGAHGTLAKPLLRRLHLLENAAGGRSDDLVQDFERALMDADIDQPRAEILANTHMEGWITPTAIDRAIDGFIGNADQIKNDAIAAMGRKAEALEELAKLKNPKTGAEVDYDLKQGLLDADLPPGVIPEQLPHLRDKVDTIDDQIHMWEKQRDQAEREIKDAEDVIAFDRQTLRMGVGRGTTNTGTMGPKILELQRYRDELRKNPITDDERVALAQIRNTLRDNERANLSALVDPTWARRRLYLPLREALAGRGGGINPRGRDGLNPPPPRGPEEPEPDLPNEPDPDAEDELTIQQAEDDLRGAEERGDDEAVQEAHARLEALEGARARVEHPAQALESPNRVEVWGPDDTLPIMVTRNEAAARRLVENDPELEIRRPFDNESKPTMTEMTLPELRAAAIRLASPEERQGLGSELHRALSDYVTKEIERRARVGREHLNEAAEHIRDAYGKATESGELPDIEGFPALLAEYEQAHAAHLRDFPENDDLFDMPHDRDELAETVGEWRAEAVGGKTQEWRARNVPRNSIIEVHSPDQGPVRFEPPEGSGWTKAGVDGLITRLLNAKPQYSGPGRVPVNPDAPPNRFAGRPRSAKRSYELDEKNPNSALPMKPGKWEDTSPEPSRAQEDAARAIRSQESGAYRDVTPEEKAAASSIDPSTYVTPPLRGSEWTPERIEEYLGEAPGEHLEVHRTDPDTGETFAYDPGEGTWHRTDNMQEPIPTPEGYDPRFETYTFAVRDHDGSIHSIHTSLTAAEGQAQRLNDFENDRNQLLGVGGVAEDAERYSVDTDFDEYPSTRLIDQQIVDIEAKLKLSTEVDPTRVDLKGFASIDKTLHMLKTDRAVRLRIQSATDVANSPAADVPWQRQYVFVKILEDREGNIIVRPVGPGFRSIEAANAFLDVTRKKVSQSHPFQDAVVVERPVWNEDMPQDDIIAMQEASRWLDRYRPDEPNTMRGQLEAMGRPERAAGVTEDQDFPISDPTLIDDLLQMEDADGVYMEDGQPYAKAKEIEIVGDTAAAIEAAYQSMGMPITPELREIIDRMKRDEAAAKRATKRVKQAEGEDPELAWESELPEDSVNGDGIPVDPETGETWADIQKRNGEDEAKAVATHPFDEPVEGEETIDMSDARDDIERGRVALAEREAEPPVEQGAVPPGDEPPEGPPGDGDGSPPSEPPSDATPPAGAGDGGMSEHDAWEEMTRLSQVAVHHAAQAERVENLIDKAREGRRFAINQEWKELKRERDAHLDAEGEAMDELRRIYRKHVAGADDPDSMEADVFDPDYLPHVANVSQTRGKTQHFTLSPEAHAASRRSQHASGWLYRTGQVSTHPKMALLAAVELQQQAKWQAMLGVAQKYGHVVEEGEIVYVDTNRFDVIRIRQDDPYSRAEAVPMRYDQGKGIAFEELPTHGEGSLEPVGKVGPFKHFRDDNNIRRTPRQGTFLIVEKQHSNIIRKIMDAKAQEPFSDAYDMLRRGTHAWRWAQLFLKPGFLMANALGVPQLAMVGGAGGFDLVRATARHWRGERGPASLTGRGVAAKVLPRLSTGEGGVVDSTIGGNTTAGYINGAKALWWPRVVQDKSGAISRGVPGANKSPLPVLRLFGNIIRDSTMAVEDVSRNALFMSKVLSPKYRPWLESLMDPKELAAYEQRGGLRGMFERKLHIDELSLRLIDDARRGVDIADERYLEIASEVLQIMGDFTMRGGKILQAVDVMVPFWRWFKHIAAFTATMPIRHAKTFLFLNALGEVGYQAALEDVPLPSWLVGAIRIPLGDDLLLRTQNANSFATPWSLINMDPTEGNPNSPYGSYNAGATVSLLSPLLDLTEMTWSGHFLDGTPMLDEYGNQISFGDPAWYRAIQSYVLRTFLPGMSLGTSMRNRPESFVPSSIYGIPMPSWFSNDVHNKMTPLEQGMAQPDDPWGARFGSWLGLGLTTNNERRSAAQLRAHRVSQYASAIRSPARNKLRFDGWTGERP